MRFLKRKIYIFVIMIFLIVFSLRLNVSADNIINGFQNLSFENVDSIDTFINNHLNLLSYDVTPITIITPGAGCDFYSWGYDLYGSRYESKGNIITDYMIRRGCDVALGIYGRVNSTNPTDPEKAFLLFKQVDENIDLGGENKSDKMLINCNINWNKHNVFLFGPGKANDSHKIYDTEVINDEIIYSKISNPNADAYDELKNFVDSIIYKYMLDYYNSYNEIIIPRVNMIGHSRGGIINMQYAIEHPDVVNCLYSVGTPYNGSEIYNALLCEGLDICDDTLNSHLYGLGFNNDSIRDCKDPSSYYALKHYWNEYQDSTGNNHTKLYAIGCSMGLDYILNFINQIINENVTKYKWFIQNIGFVPRLNSILNSTRKEGHDLFCDIEDRYEIGELKYKLNFVSRSFDFYEFIFDVLDFFSSGNEYTYISDNDLTYKLGVVLQGLFETMVYEYACQQYVLKNDLLVDLKSQQAQGYDNVIYFEKIMTNNNYDLSKKAISDLPSVGHNLETMDEDVINCILTNIDFGINDNGFNLKKIDTNSYEYIGFYYDRSVSKGVLSFTDVIGSYNYYISSKMFDCDYILAQKLYKNRYDNYWEELDQSKTDGIIKIVFNYICHITDDTFRFLKGQVCFERTHQGNLIGDNKTYYVFDGCIYDLAQLIKFGKSNILNVCTDVLIVYVDTIYDGAFFCQPVLRIEVALCNYYSSLTFGKYAFYGCKWLTEVNTDMYIDDVGIMAFNKTNMHKNRDVIINNALIYAKNSDLRILSSSPITIVAPFAIDEDSDVELIVLQKDNVAFNKDSIHSSKLESIFIYTSNTNLNQSYFNNNYPHVYADQSFSDRFDEIFFHDEISIPFETFTNCYHIYLSIDTLPKTDIFTINSIGLPANTNVIGFYNSDKTSYISNVRTEFSYFHDANTVFQSYFECGGSHVYQYTGLNNELHKCKCINCMKLINDNHHFLCNPVNNDNISFLHNKNCVDCGYSYLTEHCFVNRVVAIGNQLYQKKICEDCGYYEILNPVSIVYNNGIHYLSNGQQLDHEYLRYEYNDFTIDVCIYCGFHEHRGTIYNINNSNYHNVLCEFCQDICLVSHNYDNFISIDDDLYDGYHRETCSDCGYSKESGHEYDYDESYNDLYHLKCTKCFSTHFLGHNAVVNITPTNNCHYKYCNSCNLYIADDHHLIDCDYIIPTSDHHYMLCAECNYLKPVSHINNRHYNDNGHYDVCTVCGYVSGLSPHNVSVNCNDANPNNHHIYCMDCGYTFPLMMIYSIFHEYAHYCKCSICNLQIVENHSEHCTYYNEQLHIYQCDLCGIEYPMPHFVNDHLIIYENYEPGYDLYVCLYCGYTERKRRDD